MKQAEIDMLIGWTNRCRETLEDDNYSRTMVIAALDDMVKYLRDNNRGRNLIVENVLGIRGER